MSEKDLSIVICCIDYRFWPEALPLIRNKYGDFDLIELAGSSKNLISPLEAEDKKALLENIEISITLHNPTKIIITNHIDCGAYGGSRQFESLEAEILFHRGELIKAKEIIESKFPEMQVMTEFISKNEKGEVILI